MKTEAIVLGGGCFWCLEAIFQRVEGIERVINGYAGGEVANPSYEAVCSGETGHAEVVEITFDPVRISLQTLLNIFWAIHDPTTRNRQGNDVGTQYRSVIFYANEAQKQIAEQSLRKDGQKLWEKPIVTEILPLNTFYPAESYHQDYFNQHPEQAYCQIVINPKVTKLKQKFAHLLK
jgi:peptide-methionine (S)-S-oxide reductase